MKGNTLVHQIGENFKIGLTPPTPVGNLSPIKSACRKLEMLDSIKNLINALS